MAELNPWEEGYQDPTIQPELQGYSEPTQELNPWDEGYQEPTVSAPAEQEQPVVSPQAGIPEWDRTDPISGVPGSEVIPENQFQGPSAQLPDPSFDMYNKVPQTGNPDEDLRARNRLYEQYTSRSDGSTLFGEPTYNNVVIPNPFEVDEEGEASLPAMARAVARGAIRNTIVSGAAFFDEIANSKGGNSNLAQQANDYLANRPSGATMDEFIMSTGELAAGAIAGYRMAAKAQSAVSGNSFDPREIGGLARIISSFGSTIGGVITMNPDTETALVGDNSMISDWTQGTILEGVPIDKDGRYSEQVVAKKLNLLGDALTTGLVAEVGARGIGLAGRALKAITYDQIKPLFSKSAREMEAVDAIMNHLNVDDPETINKLVNSIRQYKDVWINVPDDAISNVHVPRTTMSAIHEGLQESDPLIANAAMAQEKGITSNVAVNLGQRLKQLPDNVKVFQQEAAESRGGMPTIENARKLIADQGKEQVEQIRSVVPAQEGALQQAEEGVRGVLREDPIFGGAVKNAEAGTILGSTKTEAGKKLKGNLEQVVGTMDAEKNRLFDVIGDAPIDEQSFITLMGNAEDAGALPPELVKLARDPEFNLTFKNIHNKVLPAVNRRLRELYASPKGASDPAIGYLEQIADDINGNQIDWLIENGDLETAENAFRAKKYYTEEYLPYNKKGSPTKEVFDTYKDEFDKSGRIIPEDQKYRWQDTARKTIDSLSDNRPGTSKAIFDLLERPESGLNPEDVTKYYFGDVADRLSKRISDAGGIDKVNPSELLNEIEDFGSILKERKPEQAAIFENTMNKLRAAQGNVDEQKKVLKELQEEAKVAEQAIFDDVLAPFVTRNATGKMSDVQEGYQIFKGLLTNEKNGKEIDEIVRRVKESGDPLAQKGLESAYLNFLKDKIKSGATGFSTPQAERFTEKELRSLRTYGNKIFEDKKVLDAYDEVISTMLAERDKRDLTVGAITGKNEMIDGARAATNFIISGTVGVLNPTATKVRNIASAWFKRKETLDDSFKILEAIHADPEYAMDLFTQYGNLLNRGMNTEARDVMWKIAVMSGLYGDGDKKERTLFNHQYDQGQRSDADLETEEILKK